MVDTTVQSLSPSPTAYAQRLRRDILAMAHHGGGAHIAPAYSIIDILAILYSEFLNLTPTNQDSNDRDRFILSKGHGCAALYAILADRGFFPRAELKRYCRPDGILGGHPDMTHVPGVEASTGSLGHGFVFATGVAYGLKMLKNSARVFSVVGDGECQEGSIWEASLLAGNLGLENFVGILDYNKLQGMGEVETISGLRPATEKWKSFGWGVREIDGHNTDAIRSAFKEVPFEDGKPSMIVAHTIKGKGISFMEGKTIWHYKLPKGEDMKRACAELGIEGSIEGVLP